MIKFIKNFCKYEDGAVTVDWVVLTAAIVGLAAVAYTQVGNGTDQLAGEIDSALGAVTVDVPDITAISFSF